MHIDPEYSTDVNGTLSNFNDDTTTSSGVAITQILDIAYAVKYNVSLAADESVVVYHCYRANSPEKIVIRPIIVIDYATRTPVPGKSALIEVAHDSQFGDIQLAIALEAGRECRLEYTFNLIGPWTPWASPIASDYDFGRMQIIIDDGLNTEPHPPVVPNRFYRLLDITPSEL